MVDVDEIQSKIEKLRTLYKGTYNYSIIDSIEKSLRDSIRNSEIGHLDSVKGIIADAKNKISAIDSILSNDSDISEIDRKALIHEKKVWMFNIERFDVEHKNELLESIELQVDSMIKRGETQ